MQACGFAAHLLACQSDVDTQWHLKPRQTLPKLASLLHHDWQIGSAPMAMQHSGQGEPQAYSQAQPTPWAQVPT